MHDTHVEHCKYLPTQRQKRKQVAATINDNMPALQHTKRSESNPKNSQAVKKLCGPQEGRREKRCEIQVAAKKWL